MIALLRSLLFNLVFYIGSVPIVLGAAIAAPLSREWLRRMSRLWAWWFLRTSTLILGVRLRIEGVVPQHAVIVASKHQAGYETILTLWLFDNPAVVMKAELLKIPVWGYVAQRQGTIPVDRDASTKAMRTMMRAATAAREADRPVVIFAEGSRMPVGAAPPLKPGLAGLYRLLKLPVVPVTLDSGKVWPKGLVKHAGTITMRFGEAIPPGLERADFEARVHAAINEPIG
jgi:1-acyl-sn-glycerol-3-phosphate acyltransferase